MWVSPHRCFAQRQKSKAKTDFAKPFIALPQKSHAIIFAVSYWWYKLAIIVYRKKLCRDLNKEGNFMRTILETGPLSLPLSWSLTLIYPFIYQSIISPHQCCSVAKSCPTLCDPMDYSMPRLPCPSPSPWVCPSLCPLHWWCHPTISSSVTLFSFWLQSFQATGSFPMSKLFTSGGQSIGASASASVFPVSIQGWFPLRLTDLFSLLSRGLSLESSSVPQLEGINSSLWFSSHSHTWLFERP